MQVAGYIRVSSEMQVENGHSLASQEHLIRDYCQHQGWTLVELFTDAAQSGVDNNRPALQALLHRARCGTFDVIVVASLDRFYRNLSKLLSALEQLRQQHVALISVNEHLDFTTPWGKLELAVLGSLAEIYVDRLRAETKRGKQARARKGLWNGSIPFGYCNGLCATCTDVNGANYCPHFGQSNCGDGKTLRIHPIESLGVKLAYEWCATGQYADGEIAEKLNGYTVSLPDGTTRPFRTKRCAARGGPAPFSRDSVREILMHVFYTGQVPYYGTDAQGRKRKRREVVSIVLGRHLALIAPELFTRCQEIRQLRCGAARTQRGKLVASFPLTGILFCADCGSRMIGMQQKQVRRYYCTTRLQHRGPCSQPSMRAEWIEGRIVEWLSSFQWPEDWRARWKEALQTAGDEEPFREDVALARLAPVRVSEGEPSTRERGFEIARLMERMGPLSQFASHWRVAQTREDVVGQKGLLRLALWRITVRGGEVEQIGTSRLLAHLVRSVGIPSGWPIIGAALDSESGLSVVIKA